MPTDAARPPRILIIGAGFGGLCMGIQLKRAGIESFTILEKTDHIGGTWRDNVYPGAACDSPSFVYCFSFEQKTATVTYDDQKTTPDALISATIQAGYPSRAIP